MKFRVTRISNYDDLVDSIMDYYSQQRKGTRIEALKSQQEVLVKRLEMIKTMDEKAIEKNPHH